MYHKNFHRKNKWNDLIQIEHIALISQKEKDSNEHMNINDEKISLLWMRISIFNFYITHQKIDNKGNNQIKHFLEV